MSLYLNSAGTGLPQADLGLCGRAHQLRGHCGEDLGRGIGIVEPPVPLLPCQDQGHPVMDGPHGCVGRCGQDAVAVLTPAPVIQPRHIEGALLG